MTKTVNIDWKGGSRRVEIQYPADKVTRHIERLDPPLRMNSASLKWMNTALMYGTDLDIGDIKALEITTGVSLLSDVTDYWVKMKKEKLQTNDGETSDIGIELNDDGSVDLDEML